MVEPIVSNLASQFKLGKKWFWIGIAMSLFNVAAGLIYGIALAAEKNHRKEGVIIMVFSVLWLIISALWLGPWLIKSGWLPQYRLIKLK